MNKRKNADLSISSETTFDFIRHIRKTNRTSRSMVRGNVIGMIGMACNLSS